MTEERMADLKKAHEMFDNRNLLIELKWQREYFKRGYIRNKEALFNLWIFDSVIKLLENPNNDNDMRCNGDLTLIHTNGLDEGIRCAMCTNSMANDRGCDGSCVVNDKMYKKVMDVIEDHIANTGKTEEPVKAHWIRQESPFGTADTCECSKCGRVIYAKTKEDLTDFPYCHCGAKMEDTK